MQRVQLKLMFGLSPKTHFLGVKIVVANTVLYRLFIKKLVASHKKEKCRLLDIH